MIIDVTWTDFARIKTVLSALKRGKYELEGEEVLAFAQAFGWAAELQIRIKASLEELPIPEPASASAPAPVPEFKAVPDPKEKKGKE